MEKWQEVLIVVYAVLGILGAYLGYRKNRFGGNDLRWKAPLVVYGAFVWADLVVFGVFWFIFSIVCILLSDWVLFLFGQSLFWVIRSFGETIFWFNQQFSTIKRYTHEDIFFSKFFGHHEYTVWFVMQIIMQCVCVISIILSVYFGKLWLDTRF